MNSRKIINSICYILIPIFITVLCITLIFQIYTQKANEPKEEMQSPYQEEADKLIGSLLPYNDVMYVLIPISTVGTILCFIYLCSSIGKDNKELNIFDKIFYEVILGVVCFIVRISTLGTIAILEQYFANGTPVLSLVLSLIITCFLIMYIAIMLLLVTTIRRIKSKNFWNTTFIGRCANWLWMMVKKLWNSIRTLFTNLSESKKLFIYIAIFSLLEVLLAFMFKYVGVVLDILLVVYFYNYLMEYVKSYKMIESKLKAMYEGNDTVALNSKFLKDEFKTSINYINDVSNGLKSAVQESTKSERLKAELITNVSHDIKTPLTSIINYVDLLKKEDIHNIKAKEYIQILDSKSQRLKKLTEDLVEASKASAGAIKLNLEKIDINELIKQAIGEYEDKFNESELKVYTLYADDNVLISADSRYLYRVIENLFSNISKYALENSRVYVEIHKEYDKVILVMKNVSKEKLNVPPDELMQRFVRGDRSRNTDGSGLGLSIAQSLIEIQGGTFAIKIDGDLFKVQIEFPVQN